MATTVGEISIEIRAKMEKLQADMTSGKSTIDRGMKGMQDAAKVAAAYIGGLGVGAFANYIKGAIDAAGALADLSQKTGVSAQTLSGLEYAAKMSGTTIEGVANGMKKLATNMYESADGTGETAEAFKKLGVSVLDSTGKLRGTDAVMGDIATQFAGLEDGAGKTALAVKIFGKSGADLIPLLNEGADGIEALRERAEELGLTISDQTAASMEALGDKFDTVGLAGQGVARQLGAELTPALTSLADTFLDGATKGGFMQGVVSVLSGTIKGIVSIGYEAAGAFQILGNNLGAFAAAAVAVASGDFSGAKAIVADLGAQTQLINEYWDGKIKGIWEEQAEAPKKVRAAIEPLAESREKDARAAQKQADKIADVIKKLDDELKVLGMTATAAAVYKAQVSAGVDANSKAGKSIAAKVEKLEEEKELLKAVKEAQDAATKSIEAYTAANVNEVKSLSDAIEKEKFRIETLGMSRAAVESLKLAKMQDALFDARRANDDPEAKRLQELIEWQKEYVDVVASGDVADAHKKSAEDTAKAWDDTAKAIEGALTDSLMRGFESGKSMVDSVRDYITNAFKSIVVKMAVQPIMGAIGSVFGMGGALAGVAGGGSGGDSGGASNALSAANLIGGMGGAFGAGASWLTGAAGGGSFMGSLSAGSSLIGTGTLAGGASGVSMIAGALAPVVIGLAVLAKAMDYKVEAKGGAIIGDVGSRGLTAVAGTRSDFQQTGGLFGGGTTMNSSWGLASAGVNGQITAAVSAQTDANKAYAQILGLNASALDSYTARLEINTTGLDEAGIKAAINAEAVRFGADQASAAFGTVLAAFAKTGETASQTLQRLAELTIAGQALNEFGGIFSKIATAGFGATESMISLAGGLDKLIAKSAEFVKSYYSAEEQTGMSARGVIEAMKAAGVADPSSIITKADFRALVESIDVTTEGGRRQLNALLDIAPQFAELSTTMATQNATLGDLAALAPEIANLTPVLAGSGDAATTAATTAADATQSAIQATTTAIESGTSAVVEAVNSMAASVAAAVASGMAAANATASQVAGSLSTIESNSRLDLAGG